MQLIDPNHPFYRTPLRRWLTVALPAVWAVVEVIMGSPGWAVIWAAAAAYAFWILIVKGPDKGADG